MGRVRKNGCHAVSFYRGNSRKSSSFRLKLGTTSGTLESITLLYGSERPSARSSWAASVSAESALSPWSLQRPLRRLYQRDQILLHIPLRITECDWIEHSQAPSAWHRSQHL